MPKLPSMEPKVKSVFMGDVPFPEREGFQDFGDRLNFLSPEGQIEASGKMKILPAKEKK